MTTFDFSDMFESINDVKVYTKKEVLNELFHSQDDMKKFIIIYKKSHKDISEKLSNKEKINLIKMHKSKILSKKQK